ncbi:MAG: YifB family Mg chelatase-like AAA ATPase [Clostridia bacterium]|nr:YifB family Mg chelatase-like AAA ATPase [Clostridia bacterium]
MSSRTITGKVYSSFINGVEGELVTIEISNSPGLPSFDIIGMCDTSIRESRGRIQSAIKQSGFSIPKGHITVSISPAFLRKTGSGFDLPIAIGILMVSNQIPGLGSLKIYANGELSLNGDVHSTPGSVLRLQAIKNTKFNACIIPSEEKDSSACSMVPCSFVSDLREVCGMITTSSFKNYIPEIQKYVDVEDVVLDFSVLKGQEKASRTILLAASGWHNTLLIGSSGSGKTTAAEIIRGLLPPLNQRELSEVFALNNALGNQQRVTSESYIRPFRCINPSVNSSGLIGNSNSFKPGEISLSNHGVLFMDELCECNSKLLDQLRISMEDREISLKKNGKSITYPCNFLFVGATNPCRCGMYLEKPSKCTCSQSVRSNYMNKLSGPFIDRIDLVTEMYSVDAVGLKEAVSSSNKNMSRELRKRVTECWRIQRERYLHTDNPYALNGSFDSDNLADVLRADSKVVEKAAQAASVGGYSVRSFKRLLKVGRTIADLEGREDLVQSDITEAMSYRFRRNV